MKVKRLISFLEDRNPDSEVHVVSSRLFDASCDGAGPNESDVVGVGVTASEAVTGNKTWILVEP